MTLPPLGLIDALAVPAALILGLALMFLPALAGGLLLSKIIGTPLRRQEKARLFVDLLRTGLENGRSPEHTAASVSRCQDRDLGLEITRVGSAVASGMSLMQALNKVPTLLPRRVVELINVGMETGKPAEALTAADRILQDGYSANRKAKDYAIVLAFAVSPAALSILGTLQIYVFPKFYALAADFGGSSPAASNRWLTDITNQWFAAQLGLLGFIWMVVFFYLCVPQGASMRGNPIGAVRDWLLWRIPWRRKRITRDFSAALGILLDSGIPEARAVSLAGQTSANAVFERRARKVVADLENGIPLPDAARRLDASGEFRWRLANSARSADGFGRALAGWQEELDAVAFRQEQTATHSITTLLVLWNGVIIGVTLVWVFSFLMNILNSKELW